MPKRAEDEHREDEAMDDEEALLAEDDEQDEDARAEDNDDEDDDEDDDEESEDDDPDEDAMDEDEESEDEDKESRRSRRSKKSRARAAARAPRSLTELAGLPAGSSNPAIISALHPYVALARKVMAETDSRSPTEALGAFRAISEDAAETGALRKKLSSERKRNNRRERMSLLRKLQKANIHPRGELFVDEVDDRSGERKVKAAPIWAEMKLGTLRQYVNTKLKGASPRKPPANPNGEAFDAFNAGGESVVVTAEDKRIAEKHGLDPNEVAASRIALFKKGT